MDEIKPQIKIQKKIRRLFWIQIMLVLILLSILGLIIYLI